MKQLEVFSILPPGKDIFPLQGSPPKKNKKKKFHQASLTFHQASLTIHQHLSILLGGEMKVMSVLPKNNTMSGLNPLPPMSDKEGISPYIIDTLSSNTKVSKLTS